MRYVFGFLCVCALALVLTASVIGPNASADSDKVQICHFPPGNMDGFHTISVSEGAAQAHLNNHSYDFLGECCEGFDDCDDGNPCTADVCHGFCVYEPTDCSDGDLCTTDSCEPLTGCGNVPVICPSDDDKCTADVCDPNTGECLSATTECATNADCDDGNLCTRDKCDFGGVCGEAGSGFCLYGSELCSQSNLCEIASCDPLQGCVTEPRCQDADPCTVDVCDGFDGSCLFDPLCEDFDPCTDDICNASAETPVCENLPIPECVPECPCWSAADIANAFGPTSTCGDFGYFVGIVSADGSTKYSVSLNGTFINQKFNFITRIDNDVVTCDEELRLLPDDSDRIEAVLCADLLRSSSICSP